MTTVTDEEVQRLLCAIYPTWYERVLGRVVTVTYSVAESGPVGWVGDHADDLRARSQRRRAAKRVADDNQSYGAAS